MYAIIKILHQDEELKYQWVFLCFNESESIDDFVDFESIGSFENQDNQHKAIHFGTGIHKIKKAEQMACLEALKKR